MVSLLVAVACSSSEPPRVYTDEEVALDEVVNEFMMGAIPFSRYRTFDDRKDPSISDPAGSGHERERNFFEATIRLVMHGATDTLPMDVARGSGALHEAGNTAMDDCAADAGWPGVRLYDVSQELGEQYEREFGLTLDMFLDLRHECSKYAATYPTLDAAYRDELVAKKRGHYVDAIREWMAANPHLVVPVEYHEGANKPYAELVIQTCRQDDEYQQCLRDARVEPP